MLECFINKEAFESLPEDLQSIVINAGRVANQDMMLEFIANNDEALQILLNKHKVQLREFPADVMDKLRSLSKQVVEELAASSPFAEEVYRSYEAFFTRTRAWSDISERAHLNLRGD